MPNINSVSDVITAEELLINIIFSLEVSREQASRNDDPDGMMLMAYLMLIDVKLVSDEINEG